MSNNNNTPAPTPGRIVLFRDTNGKVSPALVCRTHPDGLNLFVFNDEDHFPQRRIGVRQAAPELATSYGWFWPPRV